MANPFRALFGGGDQTGVLGIDIGSSAIKVVQIRKKGGSAVLETYGELSLGGYGGTGAGRSVQLSTEVLSQALRDVLSESNVTTKDCAIAIPLSSSLVAFIEMPDVDERQLAAMIPIEARKYIPVPISEVSLDWWVVPKEPEEFEEEANSGRAPQASQQAPLPQTGESAGQPAPVRAVPGVPQSSHALSEAEELVPSALTPPPRPLSRMKQAQKIDVLIVAIHNETLSRYREVVQKIGLQAHFLEIEIFSTVRAVLDQGIAPVMVFDMGASSTKLYMVEHGIIRNSHIINLGSQDITLALSRSMGVTVEKAEEVKRAGGLSSEVAGARISDLVPTNLEYVFSEANRVLLQYQKKHNKVVGRVVLTGAGVLLAGLFEAAQKKFETEVVLANPFAKLETPAFLEEMLKQAGPSFAVAVGVALRRLQERG